MALDSSSTLAEVRAQYADNASYAENGSAAECKLFIQAVRILLVMVPQRAAQGGAGGHEVQTNLDVLERQLEQAQQWYAASTGSRVVHPDFRDLRI